MAESPTGYLGFSGGRPVPPSSTGPYVCLRQRAANVLRWEGGGAAAAAALRSRQPPTFLMPSTSSSKGAGGGGAPFLGHQPCPAAPREAPSVACRRPSPRNGPWGRGAQSQLGPVVVAGSGPGHFPNSFPPPPTSPRFRGEDGKGEGAALGKGKAKRAPFLLRKQAARTSAARLRGVGWGSRPSFLALVGRLGTRLPGPLFSGSSVGLPPIPLVPPRTNSSRQAPSKAGNRGAGEPLIGRASCSPKQPCSDSGFFATLSRLDPLGPIRYLTDPV